MLTRLAVEWSSALVGARLSALQQESSDRFRLAFEGEGGDTTLIVCLDPVLPWMGREVFRWKGPRWSADPFTQQAAHALVGRRLERVSKQPADRSVCFGFGDGQGTASGTVDSFHYIVKDNWYTVVSTYDGQSSKLYVNNVLVSETQRTTTFTPSLSPVFFGRNEDPTYPYYFTGVIDEIRIH